jgi:hypothetical protein
MVLYTLASYIQLIEIGQGLLIDNWENLKAYNSSIPNYKPRFGLENLYGWHIGEALFSSWDSGLFYRY